MGKSIQAIRCTDRPQFSGSIESMTSEAASSFCIGFLGADWWGSDARALGAELRGQGHMLIDRHYEDYFPTKWRSVLMRGVRRLLRNRMAAEYNRAVEELLQVEAMNFLLVFKGMLLSPKTLQKFRAAGVPCYCVYPDVSFQDHGANIWDCLPLYDCVFTTKSFHLEDSELRRRVKRLDFVPHGFDPEVHRPIPLTTKLHSYYSSDLSFVGVWTPKKEQVLTALVAALPDVSLKIWGPFWERANVSVRKCWQGRAAYGDELAAICTNARINLGLLSEAGGGTVKGDQTTARTWQIPACGGFMLHEDTEELRAAFNVGEHIAVFRNTSELANVVRQYLGDDALRDRIRAAGYQYCLSAGYSYRAAADRILAYHRTAMRPA
jgi:spore maturation protein CgeB